MKSKLIITLAVLAVLCLCAVAFQFLQQTARKTQLHSAYEGLRTSILVELHGYYRENGRYPDSLSELTCIQYTDGAKPEMLKDFKYVGNGKSCELSYFSEYNHREVKDVRAEGNSVHDK